MQTLEININRMLHIRFKLDCQIIKKLDYLFVTYISEVFVN